MLEKVEGNQGTQPAHVLVSGGAGDIGSAVALRFVENGHRVTVGDLYDAEEGERRLKSIGLETSRMFYARMDTAEPESVEACWTEASEIFGRPDVVVVNAAIVTNKTLRELDQAEWDRELKVNVSGAFYLAQKAALEWSRAKAPGHIVFMGSWAAHRPHRHVPAYSVSKAAVRMLCRCMALEYAADGIRVNEVAPGIVDAGLSASLFDRDPDLRRSAMESIPTGSLITATEVAAQVVALCEDQNPHRTGSTLLMDGGLSLR